MMRKKNKKAIMYDFLLKLLLAIIIFVPVVLFGSKLFRLSDQALDSYSGLVAKMDETTSGTMSSTELYMDQQTIILFFNKNKGLVCFVSDPATGTKHARCNIRPDECSEDKSCVCLDRGGKKEIKISGKEKEELIAKYKGEYNWGGVEEGSIAFFKAGEGCKEYDVEFVENCYDFGCVKPLINQWIEGGSMIGRVQRLRTAYIRKCGNMMGVCVSNPPCLSDIYCDIQGSMYIKDTYPKFFDVIDKYSITSILGKNYELTLDIPDNQRIKHTPSGDFVLEGKNVNSEEYDALQFVSLEGSACDIGEIQYYKKGDKLLFEVKEGSEDNENVVCIKKV